jgi:dTDP-4-dehydrorhamnose reductase
MELAGVWTIVRTVMVYGVADDMSRSNMVLWAYQMLKTQSVSKVVDDQFRTPTLAEDLAKGCLLIAEKKAQGIYNICGPDYMSVAELVMRVSNYFHFNTDHVSIVKTDALSQPAKRPLLTGLDITKARTELGFDPSTFDEGLHLVKLQLGV